MTLVALGAPTDELLELAVQEFEAAGFGRVAELDAAPVHDAVVGIRDQAPERLLRADAAGIAYVLVHHGPDDAVPGGTYARAHHRVEASDLAGLARRLRSREQMLVTCLAFAFRNGIPPESGWVIDARCLDNPYWVDELRDLDGSDARVRDYVLGQPEALALLGGLETTLRAAVPAYKKRGRMELTVAFGCTGGRHRSVVLAAEMARRLADLDGVEIEFRTRDLA